MSLRECMSITTKNEIITGVIFSKDESSGLMTLMSERNGNVHCTLIHAKDVIEACKVEIDHPVQSWWRGILNTFSCNSIKEELSLKRREMVESWLWEQEIVHSIAPDNSIVVVHGAALIRPPYRVQDCYSSNEIVLLRLQTLILSDGKKLLDRIPLKKPPLKKIKKKKIVSNERHARFGELKFEKDVCLDDRKCKVTYVNLERYSLKNQQKPNGDKCPVESRSGKYFDQRYRLFHKFDEGIQLDEESWFSVTPERIAEHIAERCRCDLIIDAFAGAGGNAIQFAFTCERVIAIENSPERLSMARKNAQIYGVEDRIDFILGDAVSVLKSLQSSISIIDVIFISPPWGGPEYQKSSSFDIEKGIQVHTDDGDTIDGVELFNIAANVTDNVVYFLPRNTNPSSCLQLLHNHGDLEFEQHIVDSRTKTCALYSGGYFN